MHSALEIIVKEMSKNGCLSFEDSKFVQVMKQLGGYTKIIEKCIDKALDSFEGNPRARDLIDEVAIDLRSKTPEIRSRVQSILSRRKIASSTNSNPERTKGNPLGIGAYTEVMLTASHLGWKGKVDLLVLSRDACEIIDFKTGRHDEQHSFQVRVYALLWSRDQILNPSGRLASRLIIAYPDEDVEVPVPSAEELSILEQELGARREAAHQALLCQPPLARPTGQTCGFCGVRHVCQEYWKPAVQRTLEGRLEKYISDIEVLIIKKHGILSWDAEVTVSDRLPAGKGALIRTSDVLELRTGKHHRILSAAIILAEENGNEPPIITLGKWSEIYEVT